MIIEEIEALRNCTKEEILIWMAIRAKSEIGQRQIAEVTGLDFRTVQNRSSSLHRKGLLKTIKCGGRKVNKYRTAIPPSPSLEEAGILQMFNSIYDQWSNDSFTRWTGSKRWFSRSAQLHKFDQPHRHEQVKITLGTIDQWMSAQNSLRLLFPGSVVPIWRGSDWMSAIPRVINGGSIWITYG